MCGGAGNPPPLCIHLPACPCVHLHARAHACARPTGPKRSLFPDVTRVPWLTSTYLVFPEEGAATFDDAQKLCRSYGVSPPLMHAVLCPWVYTCGRIRT